jgi:hypothetical protein
MNKKGSPPLYETGQPPLIPLYWILENAIRAELSACLLACLLKNYAVFQHFLQPLFVNTVVYFVCRITAFATISYHMKSVVTTGYFVETVDIICIIINTD